MASLWPWFAVAGLGALHGLNPTTGWMLAAAWGLRSGDRARALWALLPIAIGHTASVALVAGAVAFGLSLDRVAMQVLAGVLLVASVSLHFLGRAPRPARVGAGHAGLALWSFIMSSAHGAGLMLVPALMPLCAGGPPILDANGAGPITLALLAVGVHTVAMLAVTGLVATGICHGADAGVPLLRRLRRAHGHG